MIIRWCLSTQRSTTWTSTWCTRLTRVAGRPSSTNQRRLWLCACLWLAVRTTPSEFWISTTGSTRKQWSSERINLKIFKNLKLMTRWRLDVRKRRESHLRMIRRIKLKTKRTKVITRSETWSVNTRRQVQAFPSQECCLTMPRLTKLLISTMWWRRSTKARYWRTRGMLQLSNVRISLR